MPDLVPAPTLRPLGPDDRGLVERAVEALSSETLYRRFLGVVRAPEVDLSWVDELAGPTHVAFVACDPLTGEPLGLARAVVQDDWAEIAVTVVDRWQGQRIGTRLAQALARELAERGTSFLVGTVAVANPAAIALMRGLGARRVGPIQSGTMEMRASLRGE